MRKAAISVQLLCKRLERSVLRSHQLRACTGGFTNLSKQLLSRRSLLLQGRLQGSELLLHGVHSTVGLMQLVQPIDEALPRGSQLAVLLAQHTAEQR